MRKKYVDFPVLSKDEIWDKSKADLFMKIIASLQVLWLVTQVLSRAIQKLPVTPIELATLATSFYALTTLGFWIRKPLNIKTPMLLPLNITVADVVREAGEITEEPYKDSPFNFMEARTYMSSKWSKTLREQTIRWGLQSRPIERIPNDRDPQLSNLWQHFILGVSTAIFASIHLLGWNLSFATHAERLCWRVNCLTMWCLLAVYGTTEIVLCYREKFRNMGLDTGGGYKLRWPACLWFFLPAGLYALTRITVFVEVVLSFRSLPAGAFTTPCWSAAIPHI